MKKGKFIVKFPEGDTSDPLTRGLVFISWQQHGYNTMKSRHVWQDLEEGKWGMLIIPRSQIKELIELLTLGLREEK